MHIVFLAHFAGSPRHGMVYGHYQLAREWVRSRHAVTIVGASHAHTRYRQPEVTGRVTEEWIDGVRYLWVRVPTYDPAGRVGRVRNMFSFVWQTWFRALPVDRADLVICSSHYPFAVHPALRLARRFKAKLVFEVRDLWPLTLIELGGASSAHPFIRLMQWSEDFAYRHADKVVSVLANAKDYMVRHGMAPEKFLFVPNGIDRDVPGANSPLPGAHVQVLDKLVAQGKFLVGYAGRVGLSNALHTLVDAIAKCNDQFVHAVILGEGSHTQYLLERAERQGIADQITLLSPVSRNQVADFLRRMDAAYIGLQRQPLFRFGVSPTKLNDYMLAALPIIYAIDAPGDVVAESGAGISCPAEDSNAIKEAILELRRFSPEELHKMGMRGREWLVRNREYRVLARQFLDGVGRCPKFGISP